MINTTKQALQINIKWSSLTDMLLVVQNLAETMVFQIVKDPEDAPISLSKATQVCVP